MTLAQNRLQRLNGSKLFTFLIIFLVISACNSLQKVPREEKTNKDDRTELDEIQGQRTYNPKTGKYEYSTTVTEAVDTVALEEVPEEEYTPIVTGETQTETPVDNNEGVNSEKRNSYNVAVMLPFLTNSLNTTAGIDNRSRTALDVYSGMKMAFDQLSDRGIKLNVAVMDTKASETVTTGLLSRNDVMDADLIIGPVRTGNLKIVADYGRNNQKVVVAPTSPSTTITQDNPYYVQMNPSFKSHCEAITKHVKERYASDQVVLVCRNKSAEINRLKYFQKANQEIEGDVKTPKFKELIVTDQSVDFNEMDVMPYIKQGDTTTVFIVPSWSNESFIYSFLRKMNIAKQDNNVVVYGMPQWKKYKRISYDYYERLNVHISSANYIDAESYEVNEFKQNYFNRYGSIPSDNAFVGYDVMQYVGEMIDEYGTGFQEKLDFNSRQTFHNNFQFEPNAATGSTGENPKVNWYENKNVNILKFEDFYFQLSK